MFREIAINGLFHHNVVEMKMGTDKHFYRAPFKTICSADPKKELNAYRVHRCLIFLMHFQNTLQTHAVNFRVVPWRKEVH